MPGVSAPPVIYSQRTPLTTRAVPEAETCIVYCAENPRLYSLNLAAWLVFELCHGKTAEEIIYAYAKLTVPPLTWQQAEGQVAAGLAQLRDSELIVARPADPDMTPTEGE